jgi:hypothetical protein
MENARLLLPLPYATGGIDAQGGGEPHAEYPDIDLRVNGQGYVRKNGTPYSWLPAGSSSPDTVLRLRARFCSRRAEFGVAQGAQRRNHGAKPLESDVCRLIRTSHSNAGRPNDRQDQMAIRGLLWGTLFMTVGAIVPAGAQTPPSSSPPKAPQADQAPGKTPQERCYYRYMTAHHYHHVGPKAQAACPDPNQEQPNPD